MYALVKTGGKQYRVSKDDTILVERLSAEEGEQIILNDIVMLGDGDKVTIGTPLVDGAGVSATVVRQTRGPKIIIFRRKRRKNHRRTQGHRQDLTLLKINAIAEDAKSLKTAKPAAKSAASRVATGSGTTACFFMCHFLPTLYLFITAIAALSLSSRFLRLFSQRRP